MNQVEYAYLRRDEESPDKTTLVVDNVNPNIDTIQDTKIKIGRVAEEQGIEIDPPVQEASLCRSSLLSSRPHGSLQIFGETNAPRGYHYTLRDHGIEGQGYILGGSPRPNLPLQR